MKAVFIIAIMAVLGIGMMSFKTNSSKPKYQTNEKSINTVNMY